MQEKWNQFVYYLCEAKRNGVEEPEYLRQLKSKAGIYIGEHIEM